MAIATAHVATTSPLHATVSQKTPEYIHEFERRFFNRVEDIVPTEPDVDGAPENDHQSYDGNSSFDSEDSKEDLDKTVTLMELRVGEEMAEGNCPSRNPSFRSDKVPADTR